MEVFTISFQGLFGAFFRSVSHWGSDLIAGCIVQGIWRLIAEFERLTRVSGLSATLFNAVSFFFFFFLFCFVLFSWLLALFSFCSVFFKRLQNSVDWVRDITNGYLCMEYGYDEGDMGCSCAYLLKDGF
ncbi:hypothetical protein U1Q18_025008 [Sarracenia purpurea var. burkii]